MIDQFVSDHLLSADEKEEEEAWEKSKYKIRDRRRGGTKSSRMYMGGHIPRWCGDKTASLYKH